MFDEPLSKDKKICSGQIVDTVCNRTVDLTVEQNICDLHLSTARDRHGMVDRWGLILTLAT